MTDLQKIKDAIARFSGRTWTKAARESNEGDQLYSHTVRVSRKVSYTQSDDIKIVTTSKNITQSEWEEIWDQIDVDDLEIEHFTYREDGHEEEIIETKAFVERCKHTLDMFE